MRRGWAIFCIALWLAGTIWMAAIATQNFYTIDRLLDAQPNPVFYDVVQRIGRSEARELMRYLSSELNRLFFQVWGLIQIGVGILTLWLVVPLEKSSKAKWMIVAMLSITLLFAVLITPEIVSVGRALDFRPRSPAPPGLRTFGLLHAAYTVLDFVMLILGVLVAVTLVRESASVPEGVSHRN